MKKTLALCLIFYCGLLPAQIPSRYHSNDDLTKALKQLTSKYSSVLTVESLTKTDQGEDLWVVKMGAGEKDRRKAILAVGSIEGTNVAGTEHALRFIEHLALSYGTVDSITTLLNQTTIYVIPRANPDASESFFRKPAAERETNFRPYDDDRDGETDEDDREDLNDDGFITWMRVKDSRGEWIVNPDDHRFMKKADASKGEEGMYRLLSEGIDNDKDEEWNEDPVGGTDMNRNFPYNYQFFGKNSGIHQVSESTTKAIADFVFDHPNIALVITFSSIDNLTTPWKNEPPRGESPHLTSVMKEDEEYFGFISKKFGEITSLKEAPKPVKGEGAFSEWAYYHAGRWSFAVRPWWAGDLPKRSDSASVKDTTKKNAAPKKEEKQSTDDPGEKVMKWYDAVGRTDAFLPWKKFNHPDFPGQEVEIGGIKPFVLTNPPAESLNVYAKPYIQFITYLMQQLPAVGFARQKVEKIGDNVYRLSVDVVNNGYLPTNSAMGAKSRWMRNVRVTLETGKGRTISTGKSKQNLDPIKGSGGYKTVSWIIIGKGIVSVTAESPVSGKAELKIELK